MRGVPPYTVVLALDSEHLAELRLTAPTWARHRQDLYRHPLLCFCDDFESCGWWRRQIVRATGHPNIRVVLWPEIPGALTQRERMLAAFTWGVAGFCETDWHFKLDTDTAVMGPHKKWPYREWFRDENGWVFIGHRWGYTKPARHFIALNDWADAHPVFTGTERPPGEWIDPEGKCGHQRITSCAMFGRTSFAREVVELCGEPPGPCPSHDTLWWYVAHRLKRPYLRVKVNKFGFKHGPRKLEERCRAALEVT